MKEGVDLEPGRDLFPLRVERLFQAVADVARPLSPAEGMLVDMWTELGVTEELLWDVMKTSSVAVETDRDWPRQTAAGKPIRSLGYFSRAVLERLEALGYRSEGIPDEA